MRTEFTCRRCGGHDLDDDGRCSNCGALCEVSDGGADGSEARNGLKDVDQSSIDAIEIKDPMIGQLVADRFLVTGIVGSGGVGHVYRAWQVDLDRPVALKVLRREAALDRDQVLRFHREARIASRLNHPGCVTVHDFGEWKEQLYLAMEFVEGRTLAEIIRQDHPLGSERIVWILSQVCSALETAHRSGLLHRDIKSENILVSRDIDGVERVKLADFGLAAFQDVPGAERLTQDGSIFGTPSFMSPEQCRGLPLDVRSDIYSLGCVLYEMLAATPPFQGDSPMDVMMQQLFNEPDPPSSRAMPGTVHPRLESLVMQAIAKDPSQRPQTAGEFRRLLQAVFATGPDQNEVHRLEVAPLTRTDRADRAGLPRKPVSTRLERPNVAASSLFVVYVLHDKSPVNVMALLTANGLSWKRVTSFSEAIQVVGEGHSAALIVDLSAQVEIAHRDLDMLAEHLHEGKFMGVSVIVTGPKEDMNIMKRALDLGLFSYLPHGSVPDRLPKIVRRLHKRSRRKR